MMVHGFPIWVVDSGYGWWIAEREMGEKGLDILSRDMREFSRLAWAWNLADLRSHISQTDCF